MKRQWHGKRQSSFFCSKETTKKKAWNRIGTTGTLTSWKMGSSPSTTRGFFRTVGHPLTTGRCASSTARSAAIPLRRGKSLPKWIPWWSSGEKGTFLLLNGLSHEHADGVRHLAPARL